MILFCCTTLIVFTTVPTLTVIFPLLDLVVEVFSLTLIVIVPFLVPLAGVTVNQLVELLDAVQEASDFIVKFFDCAE